MRACLRACACLPGLCRCCIMAWSIRESAAWHNGLLLPGLSPERDCERTRWKWQLRSAALIPADRNVMGEISFTCFKVPSSLLMIYFGFISLFIRKTNICKHEALLGGSVLAERGAQGRIRCLAQRHTLLLWDELAAEMHPLVSLHTLCHWYDNLIRPLLN